MISILLVSTLAFVWFLPFILVITSDRTSGKEKAIWLCALVFVSWFAWILYMLVAPLFSKPAPFQPTRYR